ncbi:myb-interacting protein 40 [Choristoneura fumiferana]|uniref:myb-interacting protein 40 n=1 Tax=Choristoneura fumiferana TaxID=7141 RepID=UPI003D15BE78
MRKRRRLLTTPMKNKAKMAISNKEQSETKDKEVVALQTAARGRLKGALKEALDPAGEDSDASSEHSPTKRERKPSQDFCTKDYQSEEEDKSRRPSPPRQSYVLKLFDRSVDLSQFNEDSPLYPICRAWIANQPKANYSDYRKKSEEPEPEDRIELPGPEGPPISRIPDLLPEQKQRSKDNINLNYRSAPPPPKEQLLLGHLSRWAGVRRAWLAQGARIETRYEAAQQMLNKINISAG